MNNAQVLSARAHKWTAAGIVLVYFVLTISLMFTSPPESDEAAYVNPGYNLAYNGYMGMTIFELRGYLPASSAQHTYWQPPLYFVLTAGLFKIFGFGVVQMRLLSILFGLFILLSWYILTRNLLQSSTAALFVMACIATDFFFVTRAAHGRMDIVCVGFGSMGLAAYTALRATRPLAALFWSNLLAGLSLLTHPIGLAWATALLLMIVLLDGRSLFSIRPLAAVAIPYVLAGGAWMSYILQDPAAFREQMQGILVLSANIFDLPGLSKYRAIRYLQQEVLNRYLSPFGFMPGVQLASRLKMIVLVAYLTGVFGILWVGKLRRNVKIAWFSMAFLAAFFVMAEFSPSKFYYYLPHTSVMLAACFGVFLYESGWARSWGRMTLAVAIVGGIQLAGIAFVIHQDAYARSYTPAIEAIRRNAPPHSLTMGSNELWFGLNPDWNFLNDHYFGFLSGLHPDVLVMSPDFRSLHERDKKENPASYEYTQKLLKASRLVYQDSYYDVYICSPS